MKKVALGIATVVMMFTMMATPAQARWWNSGWGYSGYGYGYGLPVAYGGMPVACGGYTCGGSCDLNFNAYPVTYGCGSDTYNTYPPSYYGRIGAVPGGLWY